MKDIQQERKVLPLVPTKPKKQEEMILCAFDMETRGLGGSFIICAFMAEDGTKALCYTLQETFEFIINHPEYRYLAHNASGYEFAYLYPIMAEYFNDNPDIDIIPTIQGESRIVQFIIKKNGKKWLDMRDSLCLFNASLASVASSFCPDIPKGEPPWNEAHDNFDPSQDIWMKYLWRDCEIVLVAYRKHANNIWELFGANLGVTAGSTAMKTFTNTIDEGHVYYRMHKDHEAFFREGYYGAAVFPGHYIGDWGKVMGVDVNAAYGYQMRAHNYPIGHPTRTLHYREGMIGMYKVIATVPHSVYETIGFNPIPCRTPTGLVWKSGTFETTITNIEIEYGMKVGCTFVIVIGWVFTKSEQVFKNFVDKCEQLETAEGGIYKPSTKLLRNCLYGKFGTKEEHNTVLFSHSIPSNGDWIPLINEDTGELIPNVYIGKERTEAPYIMPIWAALITAHERIYLFGFIEEAYRRGARNVYCDTDSIKGDFEALSSMVEDGTFKIGKGYGQFKVEDICDKFIVVGPKTYYGKNKKGEEVFKAKGVPNRLLREQVYDDALKGKRKQMQFESVQSVLRLIKKNGGPLPQIRKRTLTDIQNSTAWEVDANGKIYPYGYQISYEMEAA